jgi:hypothetical protein
MASRVIFISGNDVVGVNKKQTMAGSDNSEDELFSKGPDEDKESKSPIHPKIWASQPLGNPASFVHILASISASFSTFSQ